MHAASAISEPSEHFPKALPSADLCLDPSTQSTGESEQGGKDTDAEQTKNAPGSASLVPATVITINGKQFVAGLFWQPLTRPRTYLQEAREIGQREQMQWFVLQHGSIWQAGFVGAQETESVPIKQGMFSLAAVLARKLGPSWIGVFVLEDERYALIAVNEGVIIPGCDMVAERQTVQAKLKTIYRIFNWENTYLPAEFVECLNLDGAFDEINTNLAPDLDLRACLKPSDLQRTDRLKPLAFDSNLKKIGSVSAIILLIVLGGWIYLQGQAKQQRRLRAQSESLRQLMQAKAPAKEQTQPAPRIAEPSLPWVAVPSVDHFLTSCLQAIKAMPLVVGAWQFETAKCAGQQANATYLRRDNATAEDFLVEARRYFKLEPAFYQQGKTALVQTSLSWQMKGESAEQQSTLPPLATALAAFSSHFQVLGIELKLTEKSPTNHRALLLPGQQNTETPPQPNWRTFIFSLSTPLAPDIFFSSLNTEHLRLTELSVSLQAPAQLNWQIAGEIYAK